MTQKVVRKPSFTLHFILLTIHFFYCMIIFAVGLFLCLTIIGIVIGFPMMISSALPIAGEIMRYKKKKEAWELQQQGSERFRDGKGKRHQVLIKIDEDDVENWEYDPVLDQMVPIPKPWNTEGKHVKS